MGVRKAHVTDAPAIHRLVNRYAREQVMLPLSLGEVYDRLRDFVVYEEGEGVLACGALHVVWEDLAEVRSLAVEPSARDRGLGRRLFQACVQEAPGLGVRRIFVLTFVPEFFRRLGMEPAEKEALPHKVWADCVRCPRFPNCDEVALVASVTPEGTLQPVGESASGTID
jgi:amino-acid N-acetyltransferase